MIRDVVSFLDYSDCAEISLTIFVVVFVSVSLRALLTSRTATQRMAAIPTGRCPTRHCHTGESRMSTSNPLTDHAYDGIQEYDNPLPVGGNGSLSSRLSSASSTGCSSILGLLANHVRFAQRQRSRSGSETVRTLGTLNQDRATLVRFMKKPDWVSYGKSIYKTNCQSCHGPDGGGLVGLNLCDNKWKNVKHVEDIMTVINNGANNNAMPAWKQRFSDPRDVIMVSAYVATLLGTKPAVAKADDVSKIIIDSWDADIAEVPQVQEK